MGYPAFRLHCLFTIITKVSAYPRCLKWWRDGVDRNRSRVRIRWPTVHTVTETAVSAMNFISVLIC